MADWRNCACIAKPDALSFNPPLLGLARSLQARYRQVNPCSRRPTPLNCTLCLKVSGFDKLWVTADNDCASRLFCRRVSANSDCVYDGGNYQDAGCEH